MQSLKAGTARLSGGYGAGISHVADDLRGASFLRVRWQSRPSHDVTVTKPGYLYVWKIHGWPDRSKHPWEHVPDAVIGAYHKSGAYRLRVKLGDRFLVNVTMETSVVAAKIELK